MIILLLIGTFVLAIGLVLTIAFLWIYLGHYREIDVKFKTSSFSGRRYFYKEFDEDYDEAASRYNQVLKEYPGRVSCGVYEKYQDLHREGVYRIGILAEDDETPKAGFAEAKLPDEKVSICAEFPFTDPIQIRVGLQNALKAMSAAATEKELNIETFYEVYETACAHFTFTIKHSSSH